MVNKSLNEKDVFVTLIKTKFFRIIQILNYMVRYLKPFPMNYKYYKSNKLTITHFKNSS